MIDLLELLPEGRLQELRSCIMPGNILALNNGKYYLVIIGPGKAYDAVVARDEAQMEIWKPAMIMDVIKQVYVSMDVDADGLDEQSPYCVNEVYPYKWNVVPRGLPDLLRQDAYKPIWSRRRGG